VIQDLLFDRVLIEPGDGAPLDVGAADREQGQGAGSTPGGELAQVESVGLAGQAAVSSQEPGKSELLGIAEDGLDRGERG
jgi:hypothetical protein